MEQLSQVIELYGIYAVFALCTVEGDITLLISGAMAQSAFFGPYSFVKVLVAGTLGGMAGDLVGYVIGRVFHQKAKHYRFYQMAQPRIERLISKFGPYALIVSKYIYGIRVGTAMFYGIGRMSLLRFLYLDFVSCLLWVVVLAGSGYFFSGAVTTLLGNFEQAGIALFFVVLTAIIVLYVVDRYWLSEKVEEASPETIHRLEEKLHEIEDVAQEKLHHIGERLHLGRHHPRERTDDSTESDNAKD
jgi:membrane protein DedA with SNARE-associated domain